MHVAKILLEWGHAPRLKFPQSCHSGNLGCPTIPIAYLVTDLDDSFSNTFLAKMFFSCTIVSYLVANDVFQLAGFPLKAHLRIHGHFIYCSTQYVTTFRNEL